jgi:glycolate oxidase FAD binding subunit
VRADADAGAQLRDAAQRGGGHATLFRSTHADARHRMAPLAPALQRIQQELQRQFDPAGIFNRGRLCPQP